MPSRRTSYRLLKKPERLSVKEAFGSGEQLALDPGHTVLLKSRKQGGAPPPQGGLIRAVRGQRSAAMGGGEEACIDVQSAAKEGFTEQADSVSSASATG